MLSMTIKTFEDIIAWQKSRELFLIINKSLTNCKNYSYKDQLLRATLSISNNIAEGSDRGSNKELRQFLVISRGSAAEVRSMLLIAEDLKLISPENLQNPMILVKDISRLLTGFIKSINGQQKTDNG